MEKNKIIVFDQINLKSALIARQIVDFNENVWVYMKDERTDHLFNPIFKYDSDNSGWLLQFTDFDYGEIFLNPEFFEKTKINLLISRENNEILIEKLLNSSRILLDSDSPCKIDFKNKKVFLKNEFGYLNIPTKPIYKWYIHKEIDHFLDKIYGDLDYIEVNFEFKEVKEILYELLFSEKINITGYLINYDLNSISEITTKFNNIKFSEFKNNFSKNFFLKNSKKCEYLFAKYLSELKKEKMTYIGNSFISEMELPIHIYDLIKIFKNI